MDAGIVINMTTDYSGPASLLATAPLAPDACSARRAARCGGHNNSSQLCKARRAARCERQPVVERAELRVVEATIIAASYTKRTERRTVRGSQL